MPLGPPLSPDEQLIIESQPSAEEPGLTRKLRNSFIAGLLVVLPLALSLAVLGWIFNRLTGWLPAAYQTPFNRLLALIFLLLVITVAGWVTRRVAGKRLHAGLDQVIARVPLLNRIYAFFREISLTLLGARKTVFNRVVLIEYPRAGIYAIAFVTNESAGEVQVKTGADVISVFLPTAPNPTSGFLLMVPRDRTIPLEMTVAEGMKLVVSGGALAPVYTPKQ
ncbi:MAG: DUF502 domain-containing protein [Bryobacteraceae bacterium]